MTKLSIVGKDYHTEEHVVGYYNTGDRMKAWGKSGVFWGGLWGMLFGSAFFFIPVIGPVLVAGPLVAWIVGALEGAAIVGGISVLGAALVGIGIPQDSVVKYETQLAGWQIRPDRPRHARRDRPGAGSPGPDPASGPHRIQRLTDTDKESIMLRTVKNLYGLTIHALDGEIGKVVDVLFDDERWTVRYLVVETSAWLFARKVLISPISFDHVKWEEYTLQCNLTREQIKNSPAVDTDRPVSRQWETDLLRLLWLVLLLGRHGRLGNVRLSLVRCSRSRSVSVGSAGWRRRRSMRGSRNTTILTCAARKR